MQQQPKRKTKRTATKFDSGKGQIKLVPMTDKQKEHIDALNTSSQVLIFGSAGTGKTYVSATYAANEYQLKNINKIVITRPHVSVGKELGFLKGDLEDKVKPWCAPVLDVLEEHLGKGVVDTAIKNNNIEMAPLALMRGRSFNNAIVLLDEAQNVTFQEIKMLTTRIGEGSTLIINGDLKQSDLKDTDGLTTIVGLVKKYDLPIPVIEYSIDDVVRSGITKQWLEVFEKEGL